MCEDMLKAVAAVGNLTVVESPEMFERAAAAQQLHRQDSLAIENF